MTGGCWERGRLQQYVKNKIKSEIFNDLIHNFRSKSYSITTFILTVILQLIPTTINDHYWVILENLKKNRIPFDKNLITVFLTLSEVYHMINRQACLMRIRFQKYFFRRWENIPRNVASLNILVHDK